MGRTLSSATQTILNEQNSLAQFRRALRLEDQVALNELFRAARYHVAALAYAGHLLPMEMMLLAMLLEEHKRVRHLESLLEHFMGPRIDETERMDHGCLPLPAGDDSLAHG